MTARESPILHSVRAVLAQAGPCWRNNTGVDLTRGVRYGLGVGGADLVACVPVTIGGVTVGRFAGFEVKTPTGRLTPEQIMWREAVLRAGGAYHVVRSADDAAAALELARRP